MRLAALGVTFALATTLLTYCTNHTGRFALVNKSGEPIARASVTICGQTIELKDILPGQRATGAYEVKADSHYTIAVEFQSGKTLDKETGYVTSGLDFRDEIIVSDSDIAITDSKFN